MLLKSFGIKILFLFISIIILNIFNFALAVDCYNYAGKLVDINGKMLTFDQMEGCTEKGALPNASARQPVYYDCYSKTVSGTNKIIVDIKTNTEVPVTQCKNGFIQYDTQISQIDAIKKIETQFVDTPVTTNTNGADTACGGSKNYKCYTLIEPLGTGTNITKTIEIKKDGLSIYLNTIFMYLLMIIVVISVFYLIYGGSLYLTTDIINKKLEGKEVIKRVVVGLIFVFSVWTIMNTINPNLLANTLNFNTFNDLLRKPDMDSESSGDASAPITVTPAGGSVCPVSDVITVNDTQGGPIEVCKDVADKMTALITAAKAANIKLTRSGPRGDWRSNEEQAQLRAANCGGQNNTNNPSATCNPPTAIPGRSNHQGGRAIDIREAGKNAGGKSSETYKWLSANASKYGYFNRIDVEPWHWSVTGY